MFHCETSDPDPSERGDAVAGESTFARRQAKAQAEGWSGYRQKRQALATVRDTPNLQRLWSYRPGGDSPSYGGKDLRTFWKAFHDSPNQTGPHSAKRKWFVDITHQVEDTDTWLARYNRSG